MSFDLNYIADCLTALSTLPTRTLLKEESRYFTSLVPFPFDPFFRLPQKLRTLGPSPAVIGDEKHGFYGVVSQGEDFLIIGPNFHANRSEADDNIIAFTYGASETERDVFLHALRKTQSFPLTSFCEILCVLHYVFHQKKTSPRDILLPKDEPKSSSDHFEKNLVHTEERMRQEAPHGTMDFERKMLEFIKMGNWPELKAMFDGHLSLREGTLAKENLRQRKNLFIVTATLVSRSAIEGGLEEEKALSMSDAYIKKAETCVNGQEVLSLQYRMIKDFCLSVGETRGVRGYSKLVSQVNQYIDSHLEEAIKNDDVSFVLGIARPTLERRFSLEAGKTLARYVLERKIKEAKRLLVSSDQPLSSIAYCLGFSSQPHFNKSFKQIVGMTPSQYRKSTPSSSA